MSDYTVTGTIHRIEPTEQKGETLSVREFRIKTDGQYPQVLKFQLINIRCELIDPYRVDEHVVVTFNIRGKESADLHHCYTNLTAWKIQRA